MEIKAQCSKDNRILLTNIQRFSLHDGPGIRTTVFLKGCSLRCPWCSNPENMKSTPEQYNKDGIEGVFGTPYSIKELVQECIKDKNYYGHSDESEWHITSVDELNSLPGGITLSGGEPLLQMDSIESFCNEMHHQGIHIAIETSLFAPQSNLVLALDNIDLFYVDIKIMDKDKCREIEKGDIDLFIANLDFLFGWEDKSGIGKPTIIRIPVIGEMTDDYDNRMAVYKLLHKYKDKIIKIELIKEHHLAEKKYESLNRKMYYHGIEDKLLETYKKELDSLGIPIDICQYS